MIIKWIIKIIKVKDDLNNDKLNLQTFGEEFKKEKIKKEFETIEKKKWCI